MVFDTFKIDLLDRITNLRCLGIFKAKTKPLRAEALIFLDLARENKWIVDVENRISF